MANIRAYKAEESTKQIVANSQTIATGDFVALVGGFLIKAINTTVRPLVGLSNQGLVSASNNQTVDKKECSYMRLEPWESRLNVPTSATIVQADVGKYYALTAAGIVDTATGNTAIQAGSVVRLEDVLGTQLGVFVPIA